MFIHFLLNKKIKIKHNIIIKVLLDKLNSHK